MYYNNTNISEISLGKYDRFITLGCSFTRYRWATWSDLLAKDMPDAEYSFYTNYILPLLEEWTNKFYDTFQCILIDD